MQKRSILSGILIALTLTLTYLGVSNWQQVSDWWTFQNYDPPKKIENLAKSSGMSETGIKYFYVSDPQINNKEDFNINCPFPERSLVLGCYDGERIYLLDIEEKRLEGVEEVTAAHEMLHAAYARLSDSEKQNIDKLLRQEYTKVKNPRLLDLIEEYTRQDSSVVDNELHSILATEKEELSPELESYFSRYFTDRSLVFSKYQSYEKVFNNINDQISQYDQELNALKIDIASKEGRLESLAQSISDDRTILDELIEQNKIDQYNSAVPDFNARVNQYNALVNTLKNDLESYNRVVKKRNALALDHTNLIQSLDSKFQEL